MRLNVFRKHCKYCDFQIRIPSQTFPIHKVVVSAASPYFDTLFKNDSFIENFQNFIELKDIDDAEIMEDIITFMYTGEIVVDKILSKPEEMLKIAHLFELTGLFHYCMFQLESVLRTDNCIGIFCLADLYQDVIAKKIKTFIEYNFYKIITEEEFVNIPADLLRQFLVSENINVKSEYQLLVAVINWILFKPKCRIEYLDEFIGLIRMSTIFNDSLIQLIKKYENPDIVLLLNSYVGTGKYALGTHSQKKKRSAVQKYIFFVGGISIYDPDISEREDNITKINVSKKCIESTKNLLYPRHNHCVVQLNEKIFIIGGNCDSLILETVEIYDIYSEKLTLGPTLNTPRTEFGACAYESNIYVFGGIGDGCEYVEQFDYNNYKWQLYDKMPEHRFGMRVVEHNGIIYIIGGVVNNETVSSVLSYDPKIKHFKTMESLKVARRNFAASVFENYIFVFSGIDNNECILNSIEQYNICLVYEFII